MFIGNFLQGVIDRKDGHGHTKEERDLRGKMDVYRMSWGSRFASDCTESLYSETKTVQEGNLQ